MSPCPRPRAGGFSLVEILIVIAIFSILASIALTSYLKYKTKALVTSYALPILKACITDIVSYCSSEAKDETYENPLNDNKFPNCKNATQTVANIKLEVLENFSCSNGTLSSGKIMAYIEGNTNTYKAYCEVDVRPFRCYIK